jgi:hypothetical protein
VGGAGEAVALAEVLAYEEGARGGEEEEEAEEFGAGEEEETLARGEGGAEEAEEEGAEADTWPPLFDSAFPPISLPHARAAPDDDWRADAELRGAQAYITAVEGMDDEEAEAAALAATAAGGAAGAGAGAGRGAGTTAGGKRGGIIASRNVAAAAGYGVSSNVAATDRRSSSAAHHIMDAAMLADYMRDGGLAAAGGVRLDPLTHEDADVGEEDPSGGGEKQPLPVKEGRLLHFVLPSTLPFASHVRRGAAAAAAGGAAAAAGGDDEGADVLADPSRHIKARMAAIPNGSIGKVRCAAYVCGG